MKRLVTFVVFAALIGVVLLRDWRARTLATDSESITWGASEPTWSPDSRRLAFSLFGTIWIVPAEGGTATQLTVSPGYHALPAWSPKGDRIAFIRGSAPAGPIPVVSGNLVLVDVATGAEREIALPRPSSGTPTWSPDATRIACGLDMGPPGALLHEIDVATGKVTQIQFLPETTPVVSRPVYSSWNPRRREIFFTARRLGQLQVWSIEPAGRPIAVQMPLTRYRPEDVAQVRHLSALPNGEGVIYSARIVNGAGNYELYRVGREGGAPVALTNTPRDELWPAVSPDGRRVAFVSNRMGNVDLYTMPVEGGAQHHVQLNKLQFRGPQGELRVRFEDEFGAPTRVRLYVKASDDRAYAPPGAMIYYYYLDPGPSREGLFLATGDDTIPVPAGKLTLAAVKGVEYETAERTVDVPAGGTAEINIRMRRWTNWAQRGWYTGENHFHANYGGLYYLRPPQALAWLEAEDLNAANMIVANNEGAFVHDQEFFTGAPDPISKPHHILFWGEEYRNFYPLGHMAFVNIRKLVPPLYTSVPGSPSPYDYPLNTTAAMEARRQGGLVSYVHPASGVRDVMDTWLGAKEIPITAALGAVDSLDLLPFGEPAYELLYALLNCGFHISAGAGTDVFTCHRGPSQTPGAAREYVEVGSVFSWDRWIERYKQGRDFVTTGPLLTFTVNGEPLGREIRVPAGQSYMARIDAEVSWRGPIHSFELIRNGQVIERASSTRIHKEVPVDASCWFAVRAAGVPMRACRAPKAHSSAIYVTVGGKPALVRDDVELMIRWIDRLWLHLVERDNFGPGVNRQRARALFDEARHHYQAKLSQLQ